VTKPRGVKCQARKSNGGPCPQWAMKGQLVCYVHGGASPQAKAKAAVRLAEERAMTEIARLQVEPVGNALEALQQHAGIVVRWRDECAAMAEDLGDRIRYESAQGIEQLRSEMALWERALDRATVTLTALARCQVDERLAQISQRKAEVLAAALAGSLGTAGLSDEQAATVRQDFARRLLAIHASQAA
jgi:hypothetical protein